MPYMMLESVTVLEESLQCTSLLMRGSSLGCEPHSLLAFHPIAIPTLLLQTQKQKVTLEPSIRG